MFNTCENLLAQSISERVEKNVSKFKKKENIIKFNKENKIDYKLMSQRLNRNQIYLIKDCPKTESFQYKLVNYFMMTDAILSRKMKANKFIMISCSSIKFYFTRIAFHHSPRVVIYNKLRNMRNILQ